jgi:hypothetical protein
MNSGFTNTRVNCLAVSSGSTFAGTNAGVFLSTNNGTSWTEVNSGLMNMTVLSLAVNGGNIFAGTSGGGVFLSSNNGTSWSAVNSGLTKRNVSCLLVSGSNLLAGTGGSGVWYRPLSEMTRVIPNAQQGTSKTYVGGFKVNVSNNDLAILMPQVLTKGSLNIELFSVGGKRIYSSTRQTDGCAMDIPLMGLSAGEYLIAIKYGITTLSSSFVVKE